MRADEIGPKKLVVFDIDDTLVHTQTKVHVVKDGEIIDSLNSHDFTHYKLKPGEEFDFGDFRNAREFFEKSRPIIPMMRQLKSDIATGNKVVMVTARADFDDRELFLDTFRKYGIDMGKVHVYRAGNSKQGTTEERKKAIIKTLLDKDDYSKAIMYDDARPNLHTFIELKRDHPKTRFYAWHVSPEGKASEYMRENVISEKKKRKRKSRWAAYGPGPYGGYGFATGYSGAAGIGDSGVGEASYPGNVGMMEVAEFFKMANEAQKKLFKELLEKGKRGLAWKLIQDVVGVKLQGKEFDENFADGKKPGRKGLAKRSGVPTKASVSRLRKIAKSSSGEKARMAHFIANMKSGKKKNK
jgi:FMN phosphatase YigB (HAD superfamily)